MALVNPDIGILEYRDIPTIFSMEIFSIQIFLNICVIVANLMR